MSDESKLVMIITAFVYYVGAAIFIFVIIGREESFETYEGVLFVLSGVVVEIIVFTIRKGLKTKCKKCGKAFAYQVYDHNIVDESDTTITEEKDIKNKRGEKIGSYTQDVAAITQTTKQYLRCKYCGYETTGYVVKTFKK